jgi:hypothetical protein
MRRIYTLQQTHQENLWNFFGSLGATFSLRVNKFDFKFSGTYRKLK